ncbi:MAG: hypothetical protein L0219_13625, partial [Phycisphaerales bacterium]|nr:hypothetical protein [Phycisphaerales bacterium]
MSSESRRSPSVARWWVGAMFATAIVAPACDAPPREPRHTSAVVGDALQNEVLANIRQQPVGDHTIDDFNLPDDFLRRLADRIICSSFEERFRIVVRDPSAPPQKSPPPATPSVPARPAAANAIRVVEPNIAEPLQEYWQSLVEQRPPLRGFWPDLEGLDAFRTPHELPDDAAPELRKASEIVGKRLARDGLLPTLAQVIAAVGPGKFIDASPKTLAFLRDSGFPVDLLKHFAANGADASAIVSHIAKDVASSKAANSFDRRHHFPDFHFQPTRPGFRVATESGELVLDAIRLQLTRANDWDQIGDGGNIDLTHQLVQKLPDLSFIASIHKPLRDEFVGLAQTWPLTRQSQLTVIAADLPVSQWAQDNGKPGFIDGAPQSLTLLPRYASRGEDGSIFVPGDTFASTGLTTAGFNTIHSPLLFQGGNLIAVRDPSTGARILLIGEAEIYRNTALGLTAEQAREAFHAEFGVDRCEVLPSISFHIDYDVTIREHQGRLLAFVNDPVAAAIIIAGCGLHVLESHQATDPPTATLARKHLADGRT